METRKRLLVQIKARQKQGVDELFQDMDAARRLVFDTQVVELENQIECLITGDVAPVSYTHLTLPTIYSV